MGRCAEGSKRWLAKHMWKAATNQTRMKMRKLTARSKSKKAIRTRAEAVNHCENSQLHSELSESKVHSEASSSSQKHSESELQRKIPRDVNLNPSSPWFKGEASSREMEPSESRSAREGLSTMKVPHFNPDLLCKISPGQRGHRLSLHWRLCT